MEYLSNLVATVAGDVWATIVHNWPSLLLSVIVASIVQVYVNPDRLASWLRRRTWVAVLAAVALGALTRRPDYLGSSASSRRWDPL